MNFPNETFQGAPLWSITPQNIVGQERYPCCQPSTATGTALAVTTICLCPKYFLLLS